MAVSENTELEELIRQATGNTDAMLPPGQPPATEEEEGEGLDLSTLILVARRSLPWVALLLIIGFTGSWLYLRYTKPIYKASSILKIDERSDASALGIGGATTAGSEGLSSQLAGEVELIKSGIAYKRLKKRVALDVNYYTKGTVLENELFGTNPFKVEYMLSDASYYNKVFGVEYIDARTYKLSIIKGDETQSGTYSFGQLVRLPGISMRLITNPAQA
ncbi:MAG: hypothetical protein EOO61_20175, partial [Hymenobacter sp.]